MINIGVNIEAVEKLRKELHAIPEIAHNEKETAERICEFLREHTNCKIRTGIGGNGILAEFPGFTEGKSILLRAELDALPIEEENSFMHISRRNGKSHKCGHDGHMAILCGVALSLSQSPVNDPVTLLFQPAEETGEGARKVLNDPSFNPEDYKAAFALHNVPGFEKGEVLCKQNSFTAAVESIEFKIKGEESHAAHPERGNNPAPAVSEILTQAIHLTNNNVYDQGYTQITPVYAQLGSKAYGTSAGKAKVGFTLRAWNTDNLEMLVNTLEKAVRDKCELYELELEVSRFERFDANNNDERLYGLVKKCASSLELPFKEMELPFRWGEDFGAFSSKMPTVMFGLGAGRKSPPLHNPMYDFPHEILMPGINMFRSLLEKIDH